MDLIALLLLLRFVSISCFFSFFHSIFFFFFEIRHQNGSSLWGKWLEGFLFFCGLEVLFASQTMLYNLKQLTTFIWVLFLVLLCFSLDVSLICKKQRVLKLWKGSSHFFHNNVMLYGKLTTFHKSFVEKKLFYFYFQYKFFFFKFPIISSISLFQWQSGWFDYSCRSTCDRWYSDHSRWW